MAKANSDADSIRKWKRKIVNACKKAGTYKASFDMPISELADILAMRESAAIQYKESGNKAIVKFTNKNGSTNMVKNPAIGLMIQLDQLALKYWKELGLTPKGFKALGVDVVANKTNSFSEWVHQIEKECGIERE